MNESTHAPADPSAASLSKARALVAAQASPRSPALLTALLVASAGGGLFLASVWATEPEPLPGRTHAAFAAVLLIAVSWSAFAAHGLLRRGTLLVHQRVVAASMGLLFSGVFTAFGLWVAFAQSRGVGALWVGLTGAAFMGVAAKTLVRARRARRELETAYAALDGSMKRNTRL